jgi:hypothetical protein
VALTARDGQRVARTTSNARIAAAWIETWLRPEIDAPLLAGRASEPMGRRPAPQAAPVGAPPHDSRALGEPPSGPGLHAVAVRPRPARDRWRIGISGERVYADGRVGSGVRGTGCRMWWRLCAGAAVHVGELAPGAAHSAVNESASRVRALAGGAVVALPLELRRVAVTASVTAGVAWRETAVPVATTVECLGSCMSQVADLAGLIDVGGAAELALTSKLRLAVSAGGGLVDLSRYARIGVGVSLVMR